MLAEEGQGTAELTVLSQDHRYSFFQWDPGVTSESMDTTRKLPGRSFYSVFAQCMCACVFMEEARGQPWVLSFQFHLPCFLTQGLPGAQVLPSCLG